MEARDANPIGPDFFDALPGVDLDSTDVEALLGAGLNSVEQLMRSSVADFMSAGLPAQTAELVFAAFQPDSGQRGGSRQRLSSARKTRGLAAARRLESTSQLLRRALSFIDAAPAGSGRKRSRRQVVRLAKRLETVQRAVLVVGLAKPSLGDLDSRLTRFEKKADSLLAATPDSERLTKLRRACKRLRQHLEAAD